MAPFASFSPGTRLSNDQLVPATLTTRTLEPRQSPGGAAVCVPPDGTVLTGGALAGVILGTIAGTLLVLWLIKSCFNLGAPPGQPRETAWTHDVEPVATRRRSSRHSHHHRSHSHSGHSRRGSVGAVPVMVQTSSRSPRRPSQTYVVADEGRGRTYYTSR